MKASDLGGITEGLRLSKQFIESASANALFQGQLASEPYPSQAMVLNGHTMVLALFGGNQCLRETMPVIRLDGEHVPVGSLKVGDWILGFDRLTMGFRFVEVRCVIWNEPRPILRFRHKHGILECTASHKVMRINEDRKLDRVAMARVNRVFRHQLPVVLRAPGGAVDTSLLDYEGEIGSEHTIDILVNHPDHCFVAGNIVVSNSGKSHSAAHKVGWDATGLYPDEYGWYHGTRSERGMDIWVVGDTNENTRDACQKKLFGPDPDRPGWTDTPGENALISAKYIVGKPSRRPGVPGAFDSVFVKHVPSDTLSKITFKSHAMDQQALASWTGDRVWIDEEAPKEKFDELLMRVIRRKGQIIMSFTPLMGVTPLVKFLLESPADLVTKDFLGWDQAKHLDESAKAIIAKAWASQPGILKARMEGRPSVNTGLIFPFEPGHISYDPAKISISTNLLYLGGLDIGWNHPTGAVALAWDPRSDVAYLYVTYRQAHRNFLYHHAQLQSWGANMTFMIDPASNQSAPGTGQKVLEEYWKLAHGEPKKGFSGELEGGYLDIEEDKRKYIKADNTFLTTMDEMWHRFESRRLLVNKNCLDWFEEYGGYIWDDTGLRPMKKRDDLIDPTRYAAKKLREFAHRLDEAPPWMASDFQGGFVGGHEVTEWERYAAGRRLS